MAVLRVTRGDITALQVDAIVNAANERLARGGGVCGAIHAAAGPGLATACAAIGGCATGDAVTTDGFDLPARFVIHAVGPIWRGGDQGEPELLADCYRAIVREADRLAVASVAIPAISTGIYGFPMGRAAAIAVATLTAALTTSQLRSVQLVAFDDATHAALIRNTP